MSYIPGGGPNEIPPVPERTEGDVFENAIRRIGVVNASQWFGIMDEYDVRDTIRVLQERAAAAQAPHGAKEGV